MSCRSIVGSDISVYFEGIIKPSYWQVLKPYINICIHTVKDGKPPDCSFDSQTLTNNIVALVCPLIKHDSLLPIQPAEKPRVSKWYISTGTDHITPTWNVMPSLAVLILSVDYRISIEFCLAFIYLLIYFYTLLYFVHLGNLLL